MRECEGHRKVSVLGAAMLALAVIARLLAGMPQPDFAGDRIAALLVICESGGEHALDGTAPAPGHSHHDADCAVCPLCAAFSAPFTLASPVSLPLVRAAARVRAAQPPGQTGPPAIEIRAAQPRGPPPAFVA